MQRHSRHTTLTSTHSRAFTTHTTPTSTHAEAFMTHSTPSHAHKNYTHLHSLIKPSLCTHKNFTHHAGSELDTHPTSSLLRSLERYTSTQEVHTKVLHCTARNYQYTRAPRYTHIRRHCTTHTGTEAVQLGPSPCTLARAPLYATIPATAASTHPRHYTHTHTRIQKNSPHTRTAHTMPSFVLIQTIMRYINTRTHKLRVIIKVEARWLKAELKSKTATVAAVWSHFNGGLCFTRVSSGKHV